MSPKKPSKQLAGFVLGLVGFLTSGATCPWGLVLNVEWLRNPKRPHDRFFDLVGALICVPGTIAFAVLLLSSSPAIVLAYWLLWLLWLVRRSRTVWPVIARNRREAKGDFSGSRPESMSMSAIPGSDRLEVIRRRLTPANEATSAPTDRIPPHRPGPKPPSVPD